MELTTGHMWVVMTNNEVAYITKDTGNNIRQELVSDTDKVIKSENDTATLNSTEKVVTTEALNTEMIGINSKSPIDVIDYRFEETKVSCDKQEYKDKDKCTDETNLQQKLDDNQIVTFPMDLRKGRENCNYCSDLFVTIAELNTHMKVKHGDRKLTCDVDGCKMAFKLNYDLQRHIRTHTGSRPFACDVCNKAYVCKSALNQHMKIKHTSTKTHKCTTCSRCFINKCDILRHLNVHSGDRPWKCDICNKGYTNKSSLSQHQKVHKDKKLTCRFCQKWFVTTTDLTRHLSTHTGIKHWKCQKCGKMFSCKSTLVVHKKKAHKEISVSDKEFIGH